MQRVHITIRQAGVEDNERIATLGRETFYDSFSAENHPEDMAVYLDASFNPQQQASEIADALSLFLIAEIEGEAAGYARLLQSPAPPLIQARQPIQLARLYACRRWIGRGVGAALMTACIAESRQRQCGGIWLGVWGKNRRAIRFYHQWGFSEVGSLPFLLGNDRQNDLVLWLPLKPVEG